MFCSLLLEPLSSRLRTALLRCLGCTTSVLGHHPQSMAMRVVFCLPLMRYGPPPSETTREHRKPVSLTATAVGQATVVGVRCARATYCLFPSRRNVCRLLKVVSIMFSLSPRFPSSIRFAPRFIPFPGDNQVQDPGFHGRLSTSVNAIAPCLLLPPWQLGVRSAHAEKILTCIPSAYRVGTGFSPR